MVAVLVVETVATPGLVSAAAAPIPAKVCVKGLDTASLSAFFRSGASGLVGGDYPRSYPMTDGKVLWLFQDAFVGPPTTTVARERRVRAQRGAGAGRAVLPGSLGWWPVVRSGLATCAGPARSDLSHWWWPLDGEIGADGNLHVFAAEFVNAAGTGAAPGATPVAVWRAVIRAVGSTCAARSLWRRTRGDSPLYGWAITSPTTYWSYLYGNCYRQFTTPGYVGMFDTRCTREVTVARVPRGHFEQRPQYWSGTAWVAGRAGASVVHRDGMLSNPLQVERFAEDLYVGVALLDDWFGSTVVAYSAPTPVGPFTRYASTKVTTNCAGACNVYFASLTPWREGGGTMQVAVSNFTWDVNVAFRSPVLYRPSVVTVPPPVTGLATFRKDGTMELAVQPAGVRAPVAAVALEVDVPSPRASGAMVLWPCGRPRPAVVSVWVTKGVSVSAMVLVAPGERGAVCLAASTHLEFVVSRRGWVDSGGGLRGSAQVRLLDSRPAGATVDGRFRRQGAIAPGAVIEVPARGRGGIAATASTVFLGIVAVGATRPGVVQVWACGSPSRHVVLSVQPGIAAYNSAVVPLSARGTFCLSSSAAVQLMVDSVDLVGRARRVRGRGVDPCVRLVDRHIVPE